MSAEILFLMLTYNLPVSTCEFGLVLPAAEDAPAIWIIKALHHG
jgi:hypothetical protein